MDGGEDDGAPARVRPDDAAAEDCRGGSMTGRRRRRCWSPRNAMRGARVREMGVERSCKKKNKKTSR